MLLFKITTICVYQICGVCIGWMDEIGKYLKCRICGNKKMKNPIISLDQYLMGRDKQFPDQYTQEIKDNAEKLLNKVNAFLDELGVKEANVSSGWRPEAINATIANAAKKSQHTIGAAVDILDTNGELKNLILSKIDLLKKYDLWLENPDNTKTWAHLDIKQRSARDKNIFIP